ncbi:hypothetical protein HHI36_022223 [Cryptolaemus montrouzieri]|uniref:Uncharacterized protein n=1 Tax=Cryptolaemus montrouzieri TaxID=559131 RepID=A0ABD2MZ51_9CUCU
MACTENSTTIDIENCDKSENGNENVDNENQMSYVEIIIMIGTNEYSSANGIGNCDDESGDERVENENQMSNAENTEKNSGYDEDKNVDETVKKLKNVKRNRKSNSNTWERRKNKKLRMDGKENVSSMLNDQGIRVRRDARKLDQRCMCKGLCAL